jgi:hypothetical protein
LWWCPRPPDGGVVLLDEPSGASPRTGSIGCGLALLAKFSKDANIKLKIFQPHPLFVLPLFPRILIFSSCLTLKSNKPVALLY